MINVLKQLLSKPLKYPFKQNLKFAIKHFYVKVI